MPNGEQVAPTHQVEMPSNLPPPAHVSWWGEMNRVAKVAVTLTAILVFWTMIGENFSACIDRSVGEKKESERIVALESQDKKIQSDINDIEIRQSEVDRDIAAFGANFAIQTSEIGNIQADVDEIKQDVKTVQRDMRELLLLMADK